MRLAYSVFMCAAAIRGMILDDRFDHRLKSPFGLNDSATVPLEGIVGAGCPELRLASHAV